MKNSKAPDHHHNESGRGEPLVLLHGMGSSRHSWDYLIPGLTAQGHKAYALDLLGHGNSRQPEDPGDYHIDSYYRHFEEWLDQTGLNGSQFSIIGHSMGAYLGLLFAYSNPQRVKRLVLVDPFYSPEQLPQWLKASGRRPGISEKVLRAAPDWLIYPFVRFNPNVAKNLPKEMVLQMVKDYKRVNPHIVSTAASTLDLTDQLPDINVEALVIWGEKDWTLSPASFQRLVRKLPAATAKPIPNAGHTPHLTRADEVQQEVLAFLNGV